MTHSHLVLHATSRRSRNPLRLDPTRTGLLRRQFSAEIRRRMAELKRDVWDFLVTQDALGLVAEKSYGQTSSERITAVSGSTIAQNEGSESVSAISNARPQPREFQFRTRADKVKAFRAWLEEQIDQRVLRPGRGTDPNKPWTSKYIESSYKKGRANAFLKARRKDSVFDEGFFTKAQERFLRSSFSQPEMTSKIELLATRAFEELRGISSQMAQQMNRILAQGMVDGKGAVEIAREMAKKVDGLTKTRALVIARTEIINAHAEGQLDAFEELGVGELGVDVEFSTAGDDRVCPQCSALEGKIYTVEEARGVIPVHPNCRCSWIPAPIVVKKKKSKKKAKKAKSKKKK